MNCPVCNGNDGVTPCAYPGDGKPGCLRDERLALEHEWNEAEDRWLKRVWNELRRDS